MQKHPLNPQRLRRVPSRFSWVDHRLVRHRLLSDVGPCGCALYLFLVTVGDEQGLSYYSDNSICAHLGISTQTLQQARRHLLSSDLIAWEAPLYQVLDLDKMGAKLAAAPAKKALSLPRPVLAASAQRRPERVSAKEYQADSLSFAEILSQIMKGEAQ